ELFELEALGGLSQPLAREHVVALDALLRQPDADGVAHPDLEATGPVERLDQFVDCRFDQPALHAGTFADGQDAQLDLARRDARPVSSLDVAGLAHGTRRVSLEHLLNHHAADGLLGFAEDLAGLRMTKLSSFPIKGQLDSGHQATLAADPDRHGGPLYLDHVAVDLRKECEDLIDEHTQG